MAAWTISGITRGQVRGLYNATSSTYWGMTWDQGWDQIAGLAPTLPTSIQNVFLTVVEAVKEYGRAFFSGSFDLLQCVQDWCRIMGLTIQKGLWQPLGQALPDLVYQIMLIILSPNPAAKALFMDFYSCGTRYPIVAHSQGNLVTSSALHCLSLFNSVGKSLLQGVIVFALASPSPTWPAGIAVKTYKHTDDPVTWFGLSSNRNGWKGRNSGQPVNITSHFFIEYARNSQFIRDLCAQAGVPVPTGGYAGY